jgi:hypothetical protein
MRKYILPIVIFCALVTGGCKVKHKQFITTLAIEDSFVTNGQIDTAVFVLQKRLAVEGLDYTSIIPDPKTREISIQSEQLDKDWIRSSLLKKGGLVFYECYSITELFAALKQGDDLIAHITRKPGEAMPVNPLFRVLNPAEPYEIAGHQSLSPFIGMVSKNDLPVFKRYMDLCKKLFPADAMLLLKEQEETRNNQKIDEVYFLKDNDSKFFASGHVSAASVKEENKRPAVQMVFDAYGAYMFKRMTAKNVDKNIAIVIDGNILSAPNVRGPIEGGNMIISGIFKHQEAQDIANMLQSGYLSLKMNFKSMEELKKAE